MLDATALMWVNLNNYLCSRIATRTAIARRKTCPVCLGPLNA